MHRALCKRSFLVVSHSLEFLAYILDSTMGNWLLLYLGTLWSVFFRCILDSGSIAALCQCSALHVPPLITLHPCVWFYPLLCGSFLEAIRSPCGHGEGFLLHQLSSLLSGALVLSHCSSFCSGRIGWYATTMQEGGHSYGPLDITDSAAFFAIFLNCKV